MRQKPGQAAVSIAPLQGFAAVNHLLGFWELFIIHINFQRPGVTRIGPDFEFQHGISIQFDLAFEITVADFIGRISSQDIVIRVIKRTTADTAIAAARRAVPGANQRPVRIPVFDKIVGIK